MRTTEVCPEPQPPPSCPRGTSHEMEFFQSQPVFKCRRRHCQMEMACQSCVRHACLRSEFSASTRGKGRLHRHTRAPRAILPPRLDYARDDFYVAEMSTPLLMRHYEIGEMIYAPPPAAATPLILYVLFIFTITPLCRHGRLRKMPRQKAAKTRRHTTQKYHAHAMTFCR